ncbi:Mor transcription activator family protein [Pseudomonas leptonychotis]|uniref:Mor transcription activator family protein n=1 Tax=Pseudomonas leptonychotis TaxID=2448482 RepID=UPI00386300FA
MAGITGTELAASMAAVIGGCLLKHGIQEREAEEISLFVLDEVRREYSGQNIYFAREDKLKGSERNAEIYDRWQCNELSIHEIARDYGFSLQWAYRIIRLERERRRAEREAESAAGRERSQERWLREGGNGHDI